MKLDEPKTLQKFSNLIADLIVANIYLENLHSETLEHKIKNYQFGEKQHENTALHVFDGEFKLS